LLPFGLETELLALHINADHPPRSWIAEIYPLGIEQEQKDINGGTSPQFQYENPVYRVLHG